MSDLVNQPTKRTSRKVQAAAIGGGVGAGLSLPLSEIVAVLVVETVPALGTVEPQIAMVLAALFGAAGAWLLGYFARERRENVVINV